MAEAAEEKNPVEDPTNEAEFVVEAKELQVLTETLVRGGEADLSQQSHRKICAILERYQEKPELLDPHLEGLVAPLMAAVRTHCMREETLSEAAGTHVHQCFTVVYTLAKVRGYKTIVKFFPHDVSELEPALRLLLAQDRTQFDRWETRYGLLLWLSMIVLIPFDLTTVDSAFLTESAAQGSASTVGPALEGHSPLVASLVHTGCAFLQATGAEREAASLLLARLFSRPDLNKTHFTAMLEWVLGVLQSLGRPTGAAPSTFLAAGVLDMLGLVFQYAPRTLLAPHLHRVFACTLADEALVDAVCGMRSALHRKLLTKLAQRVGLAFLPPRVAGWRYRKGHRSLLQTLHSAPVEAGGGAGTEDETAFAVPEEIDGIVGHVLNALRSQDTVVRWSAAKGVGRLTMRLPSDFADEIVSGVLELFAPDESMGARQGGCLALGELARRGLLLPGRLHEAVPLAVKALTYDVRRGACSVGTPVRDAACYVMWAFARSYAPKVMAPFVENLAHNLLLVALFDREVNCRRAAAAAFQEHVGRQGNFPHGIEISTAADYFTLGNRARAFTVVAPAVAVHEGYRNAMIAHLVTVKTAHWDAEVRQLTAQALARIAVIGASAEECGAKGGTMEKLLERVEAPDLMQRHGALVALAALLPALHTHFGSLEFLSSDLTAQVLDIPHRLAQSRLLQGRGGTVLLHAVCRLIQSAASIALPFAPTHAVEYQRLLSDGLAHPDATIQLASARTLRAFYIRLFCPPAVVFTHKVPVADYLKRLAQRDTLLAQGCVLGIGHFPACVLLQSNGNGRVLDAVVGPLVDAASTQCDPITRRNAVAAVANVCTSLGAERLGQEAELVARVWSSLFAALHDYSVDNRGDVGSWVREAALVAFQRVVMLLADTKAGESVFTAALLQRLVAALLKQTVEKIDRLREIALRVLLSLLHSTALTVPCAPALLRVFPSSLALPRPSPLEGSIFVDQDNGHTTAAQDFEWTTAAPLFTRVMPLLREPLVQDAMVEGLVTAVGGQTESLVLAASQALLAFLNEAEESVAGVVARRLTQLLRNRAGDSRIVTATFRTLDTLLSNFCFDGLQKAEKVTLFTELNVLVRKEISNSKDIRKILASIGVYMGFLPFPAQCRPKVFRSLLLLLGHRYPKVRRLTGEEFYTRLLTYENLVQDEEALDSVLNLLSDTAWDDEITRVRATRDLLYPLFGMSVPRRVPVVARSTVPLTEEKKENTYADFIASLR